MKVDAFDCGVWRVGTSVKSIGGDLYEICTCCTTVNGHSIFSFGHCHLRYVRGKTATFIIMILMIIIMMCKYGLGSLITLKQSHRTQMYKD
uniref:Uncharacterized protein n=1 Tax=Anguilla anguilla TaxID=7936 RepID=A0A0E9VZC5_ANGAN